MTPGSSLRRRALALFAATVAIVSTTPVAAHGTSHASGQGLALPTTLAIVTIAGTAGGAIAVGLRGRLGTVPGGYARAVGLVLVVVGVTAATSAALQRPAVGAAGITLGAGVGVFAATRGGCGLCADATVGAVAIHRLVEGLSLAAVATVGSAVGLAGIVVLSVHTVAECFALGGRSGLSEQRALASILFVQAVFAAGAALGIAGTVSIAAGSRLWLTAGVGGLLLVLGLSEAGPVPRVGPLARPSH